MGRNSARSAAWATALLAPLCAGLGAVVVLELAGGLPIAPQVTAALPPSTAIDWSHEPTVFEPPARDELDIIAARPLFSPSRRPFVPAQAGEVLPQAAAPLPPLELIGVLFTDTQQTALIRPLNGGDAAWVREHDAVAGWRIEKIERSRVHLRAGDRLEVVELRADGDARPTPRKAREQEKRQARSIDERTPESDKAEAEAEEDKVEEDEIEEERSD